MRRVMLASVAAVAVAAVALTGTWAFADTSEAAGPSADELREAVAGCQTQLSDGEYAENDGDDPTVPVCQSSGGAVHWKADMDVDCDGQRTDQCNEDTDPYFQPETAFPQSDGEPLNSAELPHVVLPLPSDVWDHHDANLDGGTVAAVTYEDKVVYAVVGDLGPETAIGEGSYALAEALGIDPDPASGGVEGAVVDYILFPDVTAEPIEDHDVATQLGTEAATELVG